MNSFQKRFRFGMESEKKVLKILKAYFPKIEKASNRFCSWDFESPDSDVVIELKTRTNKRTDYPTTLFIANKYHCLAESGKEVFLLFRFSDGEIVGVRLDENLSSQITTKDTYFGGGKAVLNYCIPNNLLKSLDELFSF